LLEPLLGTAAEPRARRLSRLRKLWVDSAYQGTFEDFVAAHDIDVEVVRRPGEGPKQVWVAPGEAPPPRVAGFQLLPHRWIVERTIAWLNRFRRLSKDYEHHTWSAESWIRVASIRLMLARLAA
jgi:transposase